MTEHSLTTFLRGGSRLGIPLGVCLAIGLTVLRYDLSINNLFSVDFLILLVAATVVGFILAGAWDVLLEVTLRKYERNGSVGKEPFTWLRFVVVEGGFRFGLLAGFLIAIVKTFGSHGISWDSFSLGFLFWLVFDLVFFFLVGCVFGFLMLGALRLLRTPISGSRN